MNELQPKSAWLQDRFDAVCEAIGERYNASQPIPVEWVQEYNELLKVVELPQS